MMLNEAMTEQVVLLAVSACSSCQLAAESAASNYELWACRKEGVSIRWKFRAAASRLTTRYVEEQSALFLRLLEGLGITHSVPITAQIDIRSFKPCGLLFLGRPVT